MSWLRSAAIWLVLTGIIAGAVWLFWGQDLEKAWKKARENPSVKEKEKIAKEIPKEIAKKKAALQKADIPRPKEAVDRAKQSYETAKQLPLNASAEWQKTRSGAEGLVEAQKRENTRDLQALGVKNDARMVEILKQLRLYKEPKTALFPPEPAPIKKSETITGASGLQEKKTGKETAKPKRESEKKKKEPLRPML
ncbi:MAG: hypothetical protein KF713_18140 [Turneriella sp.]|nr:hypothetical protein [Turneriella sp.]